MRPNVNSRRARYALSAKPIGSGGQAEVFEARDRSSGSIVALKRVSITDEDAIARMRREIEVQIAVRHPNVMKVLDHSSQYQWYTMPLAEQSLGNLSMPINNENMLLEIVENCASGLRAAHQEGYIHRDLTPNNILLVRDENILRWVVSDWGLVRRHGQTTIARTLPGQPFGTLGFAPPEMWENAHNVDARADIYSLGRVVAYCLTSKWPVPNISLIPEGRWREFVYLTTHEDINQRPQNMEDVLYLVESIRGGEFDVYTTSSLDDLSLPQEHYTQEVEIVKEPLYSPVRAKFIINQYARETIVALRDRDFANLSSLIHPVNGVRFSAYPWIEESDRIFSAIQIEHILDDDNIYMWGHYDGSGFAIELTFLDYYDNFVYSRDFINADRVNYNEFSGHGNTYNNALHVYEDGIVVEYYFIGFEPQYEGLDWQSLQLAFQQFEDSWYLVGIIHGCWTI